MPINAEAIRDGMTAAQTYGTILASLGAFEGLKAIGRMAVAWRAKRRAGADAAVKAAEDRVKAAEDSARAGVKANARLEDAEHQQARAMRKDALEEAWRIAAEREKQAHDCHERLDSIQKEVDECKEDRVNLRVQLNQHESRLTKMENGNAHSEA